MKAATISELKKELSNSSTNELREICLRLARFKKENKELLSYLLFESFSEASYIESVKTEIDTQFDLINRKNYYYIKKSIRKILASTKKYIRYSPKKETEIELMIYFCLKLSAFKPSIRNNTALHNLYLRQIISIKKTMSGLHEDMLMDYESDMEILLGEAKY